MRKSAWYVLLGAAVLAMSAAGCGDDDGDIIIPDDGGVGDAGMGGDSGMMPDAGPVMCGAVGRLGGNCRTNTCLEGACYEVPPQVGTYADIGWLPAEADDPDDPNVWTTITPADPAQAVPFAAASGSLCSQQCDTGSTTDTCGDCSSCASSLSADSIGVPAYFLFLLFGEELEFEGDTGICRAHCVFDPATNGGCPSGQTCDPITNLCTDACRGDNACNATLVPNEDGDYATWIVPGSDLTCGTTGRCEWENTATETTGDPCDSSSDCTADIGICLGGAACAETQCNRASDTGTDFVCDGGRGVCIGIGGNNGAVCAPGCTTSNDCQHGLACVGIDGSAGSFTGFCWPVCGGEENIACGNDEQCDLDEATAETPNPTGRCQPTCDPGAAPGAAGSCEADELCEAVTGTSYGFCRPLGAFCTETSECVGGQVCTTALTPGVFGRCVDPCTDEVPGDVCAGVDTTDRCTTAGTSCNGNDLVTCAPNAQGCLVETTTTCSEGCDDSSAAAECTAATSCADPAPCTAGRTCADGDLVICAPDEDGCLVATRVTCAAGCDATGAVAVCTTAPMTPSSCGTGDVCVDDDASALDGLCATPCTAATAATVCGTTRMCQVPAGATNGFCVPR